MPLRDEPATDAPVTEPSRHRQVDRHPELRAIFQAGPVFPIVGTLGQLAGNDAPATADEIDGELWFWIIFGIGLAQFGALAGDDLFTATVAGFRARFSQGSPMREPDPMDDLRLDDRAAIDILTTAYAYAVDEQDWTTFEAVVYCAGTHCNGADKAAGRLARLGRPVKKMLGGVVGWRDEGFALATAP